MKTSNLRFRTAGIAPLALAAILLTAMLLTGCGSKSDDKTPAPSTTAVQTTDVSSDPNTSAPDTSAPDDSAPDTSSTVEDGVISIGTDEDSQLGELLVDGKGLTLYMHTKDGVNSSTCTGACAASWIPVTGTSIEVSDGLDKSDFELFDRGDGDMQVSFNGHPLYRFASDKKPGQTNGQGVNYIWYVAGVDGEPIKPGG